MENLYRMHSSSLIKEPSSIKNESEVIVAIATLVTEGRIPGQSECSSGKSKGFHEGPHCTLINQVGQNHKCETKKLLCGQFKNNREIILNIFNKGLPLCIEVLFTCACKEINNNETDNLDNAFLLEQWHFYVNRKRCTTPVSYFNINQLISAIRSQLYFSQITAWLVTQDKTCCEISSDNLRYRISTPENLLAPHKFPLTASKHEFPITDFCAGRSLSISFLSTPRISSVPTFHCVNCSKTLEANLINTKMELQNGLLDDRMHTSCTLKGKHCCEDMEDNDNPKGEANTCSNNEYCQLYRKDNIDSMDTVEITTPTNTNKTKSKFNIEIPEFCLDYNCEYGDMNPSFEEHLEEAKLDLERHNMWPHDRCHNHNDLRTVQDKGQLLLDAIERSGQKNYNNSDFHCVQKQNWEMESECDNFNCDMSESDKLFSNKERNNLNLYIDKNCDRLVPRKEINCKLRDASNIHLESKVPKRSGARKRITFDDEGPSEEKHPHTESVNTFYSTSACDIPTASDQAKFRRHLGTATSMVFHARTGLPLTSSPAPVRKGKNRFDFDSSLNSVNAIKSALFSSSFSTDDESESEGSIVSPCSPEIYTGPKRELCPVIYRRKGQSSSLLGSFEESVLNGRLEPVSTVHGFTAELGASGTFVPRHIFVPVTVFFYTLGDHDKVSSPYLGHINLGKRGYNVPKTGTVQVTLFNPLGTVVKMFVIMYDLSDMPPNSQTFIRQRTLYMPTDCRDEQVEWGPKWLRFLIHLRFMSSKSGKIYLHSDIRMIIMRRSDMDTATAHGIDMSYELRSFTHVPNNPKYSSRK